VDIRARESEHVIDTQSSHPCDNERQDAKETKMIPTNFKEYFEVYGGAVILISAVVVLMAISYFYGYNHGATNTFNDIRTCFLVKGEHAISFCLPK
jgi:hypothetical protein